MTEPKPTDGPDFHAEHAFWRDRRTRSLERVLGVATLLDRRLTDLIGTEHYPNPLTELHTELRLALWEAERHA